MDKSDPETEKVISSPSASLAVIVATEISFSFTEKVDEDVNTGSLSLRLLMFTVITCVLVFTPSLTETMPENEVVVS